MELNRAMCIVFVYFLLHVFVVTQERKHYLFSSALHVLVFFSYKHSSEVNTVFLLCICVDIVFSMHSDLCSSVIAADSLAQGLHHIILQVCILFRTQRDRVCLKENGRLAMFRNEMAEFIKHSLSTGVLPAVLPI